MNFDQIHDRHGTHSEKWDDMESEYGVASSDGLAMWVADMDFRSPDCVQDAVRTMLDNGNYGYFGDYSDYKAAICWWMANRHGWQVDAEWIFTTHGLGNAIALALQTYTQPGDGVVLFTPVYHTFARVTRANARRVVECPLVIENGRYVMDFSAYDAQMTGAEKAVIFCSPHNPGGRVWDAGELAGIAAFCERHDLLLISDEIHHDLVYPGNTFASMPVAVPDIQHRLLMLTAASKTFNTAGTHTGNVIIPDDALRARFKATMAAINAGPANFGLAMVTAAYSPQGAAWLDALMTYLDQNRRLFDDGVNAIPGLAAMQMQATYLSWVDFSGTGMAMSEVEARIYETARIAANQGETFGTGGEHFMRFNIGTQHARIVQAVERLQHAFADLQ
jgi:cysteine-S-conjugate beta-lyase